MFSSKVSLAKAKARLDHAPRHDAEPEDDECHVVVVFSPRGSVSLRENFLYALASQSYNLVQCALDDEVMCIDAVSLSVHNAVANGLCAHEVPDAVRGHDDDIL